MPTAANLRAACAALLIGCGADAGPDAPSAIDAGATPALSPSSVEVHFACDPSAPAAPDELRRLTMTQYKNTVHDLVRELLDDEQEAAAALNEAGFAELPQDQLTAASAGHAGYRRLDQAVDQGDVDATYSFALALANALTVPTRLNKTVGACATDTEASNDDACLSAFLHSFGARALRRPFDAEDDRFYRLVYGEQGLASAAGYADVIAVLLTAPELLYFVEHGQDELAGDPGVYQLSPYELASRLSYHFWQTLPDEELWRAAEDGALLTPDMLAQQVARLMADPRARVAMAELFTDWLGLDDVPALDARVHDPLYAAFAGDGLPGPTLRRQVIDDALDMLAYYTWSRPSGFESLLRSDLSFARGAQLAHIYGVPAWDGSSAPPSLRPGERSGLLTRAWFLATGSANTRPIVRGAFIRRALLCDELSAPPGNVNALPPAEAPDQTTRHAVEALTEQPGTACASCHQTQINPLGFAFEGFDALARPRAMQRLFYEDGRAAGSLPIDTASVPRVTADDARATSGPVELAQRMLQSGKLEACFARNYFRFTFGRAEELARDGCALERLRARLVESGRIRDTLAEAGLLPELQRRRFEP